MVTPPMTTQLEEIGLAVYRERERRGQSIVAIAKEAGVTHQTWARIERGWNVETASLGCVLETVGLKIGVIYPEFTQAPSISNGLKGDH